MLNKSELREREREEGSRCRWELCVSHRNDLKAHCKLKNKLIPSLYKHVILL